MAPVPSLGKSAWLRLTVEHVTARALLKRVGFREVGIYERHAQLHGTWRDVVIVERLLDVRGVRL